MNEPITQAALLNKAFLDTQAEINQRVKRAEKLKQEIHDLEVKCLTLEEVIKQIKALP